MKMQPKYLFTLSALLALSALFLPTELHADSFDFFGMEIQTDPADGTADGAIQDSEDAGKKGAKSALFGMRWFNAKDLLTLAVRFAVNLFFMMLIVRFIYYPNAKRKDYLFTFLLIGFTVFLLCIMLESVKLDLAFALGLFAVFGIIRYRTDAIPTKEMTYLFIVIGMAVMNALINKKISVAEMVFANMALVGATYGLEKVWLLRHEQMKIVLYERVDLIKSGRRQELFADLEERTGIKINRVEIGKIDFLRDTVQIFMYFYQDQQPGHRDESAGTGAGGD